MERPIDHRAAALDGLLQQAITAAKDGQFPRAQTLLQQVLTRDPDNLTAWLWLSGVVSNPLKREACLQKALKLAPGHEAARRGLMIARREAAAYIMPQAIAAAQAGETARARKLLTDVVVRDETNVEAWLWLSRVVETPEDREICFQNILMLDSENDEARSGLSLLQGPGAAAPEDRWGVGKETEDDTPVAPTLAGDILGDAYREKHTTTIPEPESSPEEPASVALWAKYDDPYLCPVCAGPARAEDQRCPECRAKLWTRTRAQDQRSQLLWILILLQMWNTLISSGAPFLALFVVSMRVHVNDTLQLLAAYLGRPSNLSTATVNTAMEMLSRTGFFLLGLPFVLGVAGTIALYLRWRPVFYLLLGSGALGLAGSIGGIAFLGQQPLALAAGVLGIAVAVGTVILGIRLEDDFRVQRRRRLLALDPGLPSGIDYLVRGRYYAHEGVWGLAALHFRRAAALMPNDVDGLLGVVQAAVNLGDWGLSRWALESALERQPGDERIEEAAELVRNRMRTAA